MYSLPVDPNFPHRLENRGVPPPKPQFVFPEIRSTHVPIPVTDDDEEVLKQLERYKVTDSLSESMRLPHVGLGSIFVLYMIACLARGYYFLMLGILPSMLVECFHWLYARKQWPPSVNSHMLTAAHVFCLTQSVYWTGGYKSPFCPVYLVVPHFFTPATSAFHRFITFWTAVISAIFIYLYLNHSSIPPSFLPESTEHGLRIGILVSTTIFWLFIGSTRASVLKEALKTSEMAQSLSQKSNRMKSNFLANMSHELRTPLTGICGFADLLQHNKQLNLKEIESLRLIQLATNSVISTISGILDYSTLEEGTFNVDCVPLDICKTVEEALETCCYILTNGNDVELWGTLSKRLQDFKFRGDPTRIGQSIINLISNALKFTDIGKVELRLALGAVTGQSAELLFEVIDTGIGISHDDQKRLFSAFQQAPNSRR